MVNTQNQLSGLIESYKTMAPYYDAGDKTLAAGISNFVTKSNLVDSLSNMQIGKILDAGGGTGKWSIFLAEKGYDVTLMDISPDLLKIAQEKIYRKNLSIKIIEGNLEQSPFEDNSFDFIFAEGGVASLTPNPVKMLKEFKRLVRSGGYIWMDYLNLLGWTMLQDNIKAKEQLAGKEEILIPLGNDDYPFRLFIPKKIRYMLYDAGFLELREFGNGILTHPMMKDSELESANIDKIKQAELKLSKNYNSTGAAFHIQILAQKIIH